MRRRKLISDEALSHDGDGHLRITDYGPACSHLAAYHSGAHDDGFQSNHSRLGRDRQGCSPGHALRSTDFPSSEGWTSKPGTVTPGSTCGIGSHGNPTAQASSPTFINTGTGFAIADSVAFLPTVADVHQDLVAAKATSLPTCFARSANLSGVSAVQLTDLPDVSEATTNFVAYQLRGTQSSTPVQIDFALVFVNRGEVALVVAGPQGGSGSIQLALADNLSIVLGRDPE